MVLIKLEPMNLKKKLNHGSDFAKASSFAKATGDKTTDRFHGEARMKRIGNLKSQISNLKKEARSSS